MKVLVFESYEEMSRAAADIMACVIKSKPDGVLGLATGSTPVGMYNCLADMCKSGELDFSSIKTVNLDEYYPISPDNRQSYRYFMNENLFSKININIDNTNVPAGNAEDADLECQRYEKLIDSFGGIDIQVLGIGQNGHIGFNEPEEKLYSETHVTGLTESTMQANARFFSEDEIMPDKALTMGMGSIFKADKILVLANGKSKRDAVSQLVSGRITTSCPVTLLNLHKDVTLICDKEALGE